MSKIEVRSAGLLVTEGKILLVNHEKHGRSYWVLPGGHVEFGESLEDALAREMREELELNVTVGPLVIVHDFIVEDRHVVNNLFRVTASSTAFRVRPERALKDARWVPVDDLEGIDLLPPIADRLRQVIEQPSEGTIYLGRV